MRLKSIFHEYLIGIFCLSMRVAGQLAFLHNVYWVFVHCKLKLNTKYIPCVCANCEEGHKTWTFIYQVS